MRSMISGARRCRLPRHPARRADLQSEPTCTCAGHLYSVSTSCRPIPRRRSPRTASISKCDVEIGRAHIGIGMGNRGSSMRRRRIRSPSTIWLSEGLSHHRGNRDLVLGPDIIGLKAPTLGFGDGSSVQRTGQQRRVGAQRRQLISSARRRRRQFRPAPDHWFHQDRRPHQLSHGAHRSRQGDAAAG